MKKNNNMKDRYFDYLLTYVNTIFEFSDELQRACKKKLSGEIFLAKKKYTYFKINNWVTILNRKNDLELSFIFNNSKETIFFQKNKFHNFIESDLNANGLWKDFQSNKIARSQDFEGCFSDLINRKIIVETNNWFEISSEELY